MNIIDRFLRWIKHDDGVRDFTGEGSLTSYLLANRRGETSECPKLRRRLNKASRHLERQRAEMRGEVISIQQRRNKA